MSKKIEIINNAIVVTDTVSGLVEAEFPSRDIYFDTQELEAVPSIAKLYDTNGVNEGSSGVWSALLADCVDSGLVPFTAASFRAFARVSLGFNIPPAPPPAAQDLQSVLNNGSTATISTAFAIALDSGNGIVLSEDIVGLEGEAKISAFGGGYGLGYVQLSFDDTISFGGVQSIRLDGINSSGIVVTEGANSRGLLYATDYSANYTIRSLVDKAYVDAGDTADTLAAVLAAGNSITANPIDVIAGGAGIIFKGNAFSTITADGATDGIVIGTAPNADFRLVSGAGGDIVISLPIVTTGELQIGKNLGDFGMKISTASLILSDNVYSKGFVYAADYSANYTIRSIVDKGYVDAAIPLDSAVTANTAKVTNATHTGDVAGDTILTIGAKKVTAGMMSDGVAGELFTFDNNGVISKVPVGTATHVLTSNGLGLAPTFQVGGGGGGSPLTTKGDLFGFTTVDARLAVGTNNQKLVADSAEASGLKWATEVGSIDLLSTGYVSTAGTASIGYDTDDRIYYQVIGSNAVATYVKGFVIPADFESFPANAFEIDTWRDAAGTITVDIFKNGVVDTTITGLDVSPVGTSTWETITSSFGSTYVAGDRILFKVNLANTNGNNSTRTDVVNIKYNKK